MTSQAIRKVHSESSGRTCSEEMDAICASPWAPGGIWFPSRSRIPYPRAWSIPAPPSLVALPPMPTMNLRQPFWMAARITSPTPKVVVFIGSFSASGTRVIPAAPDISMIAVPLSGRMPYWQSTGLPMGPVTVTVSRVPPMPQARASTVPSPPSAKGRTFTAASLYTRRIPSSMAWPASREERLPFRESMAMVIFIILSLRLLLFHNKVGK